MSIKHCEGCGDVIDTDESTIEIERAKCTGKFCCEFCAVEDFNESFVQARLEMPSPKLDAYNPYFKSKFATLKEVVRCTIPVLARHGITVHQDIHSGDGVVEVFTTLTNNAGVERNFGPFGVPVTKKDAQGYGAAASYARRYHLLAVCGIVGDVDDDGESIAQHDAKQLFKSAQSRTTYIKKLRAAAADNDSGSARELWDELDNEQRLDVWADLPSIARSALKNLLKASGEEIDYE